MVNRFIKIPKKIMSTNKALLIDAKKNKYPINICVPNNFYEKIALQFPLINI